MTLQELTIEQYNKFADEYITRSSDFKKSSQEANQWWKPKIKKHWLFLIQMAQFYINNSKNQLKRLK